MAPFQKNKYLSITCSCRVTTLWKNKRGDPKAAKLLFTVSDNDYKVSKLKFGTPCKTFIKQNEMVSESKFCVSINFINVCLTFVR